MTLRNYLIAFAPEAGAGTGETGKGGAPGAGAGANGGGEPFYKDWGLDNDGSKYLADSGAPDPATVVKRLRDMERVARDRNVIPRPDTKDPAKLAEWEGWETVGWVKDPAKYTLAPPKDLPQGVTYSGELFDKMRQAAHEARVPLPAAQKIHDTIWNYMLDGVKKLDEAGAKSKQELETALRNKWAGDFDRKSEIAKRAMAAFNPKPQDTSLVGKLSGEPALVEMFAAIGEKLGEASLPAHAGGGGFGAPSKEQAAAERRKLEGDGEFMKVLSNPRHPQHKEYAAKRQRLINIEAGEAA